MPTPPNQTQPFSKFSPSVSPPLPHEKHTWTLQTFPSSRSFSSTPRSMADSSEFNSELAQARNQTVGAYITNGVSDYNFTAIGATPPPLDPLWQHNTSTANYISDMGFDPSVGPEYSTYPEPGSSVMYTQEVWGNSPPPHVPGPSNYQINNYGTSSASQYFRPPLALHVSPGSHGSPSSSEFTQSSYGGSPTTPNLAYGPLPHDNTPEQPHNERPLFSHREQLQFFREALVLPMARLAGPFVPQQMYRPHTNSDRRRYVEEVDLEGPIYFWMENPTECGIPLVDALHSRVRHLQGRENLVFQGRGPSISVRLQWPGYRQWSRQIPTKDFRSPPGPITMSKLTKNVAKCVQRFIDANKNHPLEDDADVRWKVGNRQGEIRVEDLILVSMHHVSMGSWQPQLRLVRPFT